MGDEFTIKANDNFTLLTDMKGMSIIIRPGMGGGEGAGSPGNPLDGSFIFQMADGKEFLRAEPNGDIYVRGTKVESDLLVYKQFREWFSYATVVQGDRPFMLVGTNTSPDGPIESSEEKNSV